MYKVKIISIFPDSFPGILGQGVIGKAHSKKIWSLKTIDPRKYTKDKHKKIDDTTAGGGPGMIFKPDIMGKAIDACYRNIKFKEKYKNGKEISFEISSSCLLYTSPSPRD